MIILMYMKFVMNFIASSVCNDLFSLVFMEFPGIRTTTRDFIHFHMKIMENRTIFCETQHLSLNAVASENNTKNVIMGSYYSPIIRTK